jgi:hypothetical protein
MKSRSFVRLLWCALPFSLAGCPREKNQDELTAAEATQALEESAIDSQAQALTSDTIEITTHFTIGQAAETAAAELRTLVETQLPCAEVTLSGATLTVDYGVTGSGCLYHGRIITGESEVSIAKNEAGEVVVEHRWNELSNGVIRVDGQATVTWNLANPSRHVVHQVNVIRVSDGVVFESHGDRTQKPLAGGLAEGFQVDGTRGWTGPRGQSSLTIQGVQMRWADPVPQAGTYLLTTPQNKDLSLSFARKDADTITVTLTGPKRSYVFDVSKSGTTTRTN